jgi:HEAT repeat protein
MDRPDRQVVAALVSAATSDPNVNVRLAAIEALAPRAGQPPIFSRLVRSLPEQDSPLVQVALVDLLLESDGQAARDAALRLASDANTDPQVRRHVRERLGNLI